jgi:hypothetical protein
MGVMKDFKPLTSQKTPLPPGGSIQSKKSLFITIYYKNSRANILIKNKLCFRYLAVIADDLSKAPSTQQFTRHVASRGINCFAASDALTADAHLTLPSSPLFHHDLIGVPNFNPTSGVMSVSRWLPAMRVKRFSLGLGFN